MEGSRRTLHGQRLHAQGQAAVALRRAGVWLATSAFDERTEHPVANPNDWRETRTPEQAAAETEEPEAAARVRAEDDAETRARQAQAEADLRAADRALEDGEARLRRTRDELRRREEELERTGDLTREVAQNAANLLQQTEQIADQARRTRPAAPDASAPPSGTESDR
jgi:hypothetical protein